MTAAFVCDHSGGYMQQRQSKPHVSPSPDGRRAALLSAPGALRRHRPPEAAACKNNDRRRRDDVSFVSSCPNSLAEQHVWDSRVGIKPLSAAYRVCICTARMTVWMYCTHRRAIKSESMKKNLSWLYFSPTRFRATDDSYLSRSGNGASLLGSTMTRTLFLVPSLRRGCCRLSCRRAPGGKRRRKVKKKMKMGKYIAQ